MGTPFRITSTRDEKYSRVTDRKQFDANMDEIQFPSKDKPKGGRTRIVYHEGKRTVVYEDGKLINDVKLTARHCKSGVSVYDIITQPNGPDSEPTTMTDISEAAKAAGVTSQLGQSAPSQQ